MNEKKENFIKNIVRVYVFVLVVKLFIVTVHAKQASERVQKF